MFILYIFALPFIIFKMAMATGATIIVALFGGLAAVFNGPDFEEIGSAIGDIWDWATTFGKR